MLVAVSSLQLIDKIDGMTDISSSIIKIPERISPKGGYRFEKLDEGIFNLSIRGDGSISAIVCKLSYKGWIGGHW